ncbi:MAG: hypothetical protein P4N41_04390 [Negativicutes bacterium]|nr:hypothetical protein [Negativicutes bacterium]
MDKKRTNGSRGFVLMDVILGMFILVVALVAMGGLYYQSTRAYIFADNRTVAYHWAQERMEYLKSDASWRGNSSQGTAPASPADAGNSTPPRTGFSRTTTVALASLPAGTLPATTQAVSVPISKINARLIDVTVTVNWTENGQTRSVNLRTFIERD